MSISQLSYPNFVETLDDSFISPIYWVSIVVPGQRGIGSIKNLIQRPQVGDVIVLDQEEYKIVELAELMSSGEDFIYLHATCQPC